MFKSNKRTSNLLTFLDKLIIFAQSNNKQVIIAGGFAIEMKMTQFRNDTLLSRNHDDLDVHVLEKDISYWKEWFISQKFTIQYHDTIIDKTQAFVAYSIDYIEEFGDSNNGFYVDVYGFTINNNGYIVSKDTGVEDNWGKKWNEIFEEISWNNKKVTIMRPEDIINLKKHFSNELGTPLRKKDLHDIKLINQINPDV